MKGMIMGAESVRAILDGRKTQTRRVVNSRLFIEIDPLQQDVQVLLQPCVSVVLGR